MNDVERRADLLEILLKNARVESLQIICGVYFLIDRGNVVYVGQSKDVLIRIRRHFADPTKRFDSWAYLPIDREMLEDAEREYITLFQPYLNQTIVRKVNYRRQRPQARRQFSPKLIVHTSGLYEDIEVTDEDHNRCTTIMDQIMRGQKLDRDA